MVVSKELDDMEPALLGVALVVGILHSLEPDHVAAVTAFVVRRPGRWEAIGYGLRWSLGHGGIVLLVGTSLLVLPIHLDESVGVWLERAVGVSLVLLGGWVLATARTLHAHHHRHADGTEHVHLHAHPFSAHPSGEPGNPEAHRHRHAATLIGALHGMAGTATVVAMVPLVAMDSVVAGAAFLAVFGFGTAVAMVLYAMFAGVIADRAARRSIWVGRALARTAGLGTVAVGIWWLVI
jgi:cytochrome c biogenesis protein CcdA